MIITNDKKSITSTIKGYDAAYGNTWIEQGEIINYKIKIDHVKGTMAFIGIASCDNVINKNIFYSKNHSNHYYGFKNMDTYVFYNDEAVQYGQQYITGDIMEMCFDLKNYQLSYKRNNQDLGIAFDKLYQTKYKLAIVLIHIGDKMTIIELN